MTTNRGQRIPLHATSPVAIGDSVKAAREADGVWFFTK